MTTCPTCHQPATTRDGFDCRGRHRFASSPCHRDFTHASSGAFSGYRWPPDVIVKLRGDESLTGASQNQTPAGKV